MKSKTTIEVNGKRYDATTGAIVSATSDSTSKPAQNINGFFRSPHTPGQTIAPASPITVLAAPLPAPKAPKQPGRGFNHARAHAPEPTKTNVIRVQASPHHSQSLTVRRSPAAANHTKHHAAQSSQTLVRTAVKRPAPSFHKQVGTVGALQHQAPSLVVPKKSVVSLDPERLVRAQTADRSPLVEHHSTKPAVTPLLAQLPVQAPPDNRPQEHVPSAAPAPKPDNGPADIFQHALANAGHFVDVHAHRAHFKKKARRHVASMAAGTLALVVIAGFAAYQNTPGLQFKIASVRAGVSTHVPNFSAAGFAYNGVKTENGKLTVGFSGSGATYQLTQENTNLTGDDVIQTVGSTDASGTPDYTTIYAGSTPVYRLGNNEAMWVQDGTWYTVNGNGSLSNAQLSSLVRNT